MPSAGAGTLALSAVLATISLQYTASLSLDEGPQAQVAANVGDTVVLTCDLRNVGERRVHWYHQETHRYLSINRVIYRRLPDELETRLTILGDPSREQFNLRIEYLRQSDSGTYICQHAFPEGLATSVASSTLTVYIPPDPGSPECRVDSSRRTAAQVGDWVTLRCTSTGNPPPLVSYHRGDSGEVLASTTSPVALQWQLMPKDNGVDFTCTMTSPVLSGPRTCSVRPLEIFPTAEVSPAQLTAEEGTRASLDCRGFGEPNIARYRWEIRDTLTRRELPANRYCLNPSSQSVEISSVRENITATCFVSTPSGLSGSATAMVNVIPPNIVTTVGLKFNSTSWAHNDKTTISPPANTTLATSSTSSLSARGNSRRPITAEPTGITLPITPIVAVSAAILATLVVIICIFCVRRRRQKRRKPLASSLRYDKVRGGSSEEYFGVSSPTKTADTTVQMQPIVTTEACPLYAVPDKPRRGQPRNLEEDQFLSSSGIPLKAVSNKRRRNGFKRRPALRPTSSAANHAEGTDSTLCVQPKKTSKRVKWNLDINGFSGTKSGGSKTAETNLMYADLDLDSSTSSSGSNGDSTRQSTVSTAEETIYAQISNRKPVSLDFGNLL
ncbi:hemicentin-2-like [Acanthaster planci]|uniref:Hemicentin-2-like n=1 Tax=Acanthaster planci TaxID=133434 RepID=A0A8B7Y1D7_ACAPL|nr:hemicentin-2-like [Acanthaster planci]